MVTVVEISFSDSAGPTGAFSYILAGHFKMHASGMRPFGLMNLEESTTLLQEQVERSGLIARRRCDRIAMHWIARPQHNSAFALYRTNKSREMLTDFFRSKATDQC